MKNQKNLLINKQMLNLQLLIMQKNYLIFIDVMFIGVAIRKINGRQLQWKHKQLLDNDIYEKIYKHCLDLYFK